MENYSNLYEELITQVEKEEAQVTEEIFTKPLRTRAAEFAALTMDDARRAPTSSIGSCTLEICDSYAATNKAHLLDRSNEIAARSQDIVANPEALRTLLTKNTNIPVQYYLDHWIEPCSSTADMGFSQRAHMSPEEVKALLGDDIFALAELFGIGTLSFCYEVSMGAASTEPYPSGQMTSHLGKILSLGIKGNFVLPNGDKALVVHKKKSASYCFDSGDSVFGRNKQIVSFLNGAHQVVSRQRPADVQFDCPYFDGIAAAPNLVDPAVSEQSNHPDEENSIPNALFNAISGDTIVLSEKQFKTLLPTLIEDKRDLLIRRYASAIEKATKDNPMFVSVLSRINEDYAIISGAIYFYFYQDFGSDIAFRSKFGGNDQLMPAQKIVSNLLGKFVDIRPDAPTTPMGAIIESKFIWHLPTWDTEEKVNSQAIQQLVILLKDKFATSRLPQTYPITEKPQQAVKQFTTDMLP